MAERARRDRVLHLRLTEAEHESIRVRARLCGHTVSAFLRSTALGHRPRAKPGRLEREAIRQLARIGNNLNQLTRHANGTRRVELSRRLAEVLASVEATVRRLK